MLISICQFLFEYVNLHELFRCQGIDVATDLPHWRDTGVKESEFRHMCGNSVCLPVLSRILAEGLWSAGLVASKPVFESE